MCKCEFTPRFEQQWEDCDSELTLYITGWSLYPWEKIIPKFLYGLPPDIDLYGEKQF